MTSRRRPPALPRAALLALVSALALSLVATVAISATPSSGTLTEEPGMMVN